jgi:hypothetical protein
VSNGGSGKYLVIGCVAVALLGVCLVGGGTAGFFWYVAESEERAQQLMEELERAEEQERMAAAEQAEEAERARAAEEARLAALLVPPPPLTITADPTRDRRRRRIEATVVRAEGESGLTVGQRCEFDVTVLDREGLAAGYWCRALVDCGGVRLYGEDRPDGSGNGYFGCAIWRRPRRGVAGEDRETSAAGSDPFFQIDTRAGTLVVFDDDQTTLRPGAYRVEATIDTVR